MTKRISKNGTINHQIQEQASVKQQTLNQQALGLLEWFVIGEHERVEAVLRDMHRLGIKHLRTGISWADWHTPEGAAWFEWLLPRLAAEVDVLPCVLYTPPSLGIEPRTAAPPREPKAYADFVDYLINNFGEHFSAIEFWNEANNLSEWDWTLDENWVRFAEMVGGAAYWAKHLGKQTVLGGMSPIDPGWLKLMFDHNVMNYIDVVGIHGFPGVWESNWHGWDAELQKVQTLLDAHQSPARIWITEVGFSTVQHDEFAQLRQLLEVSQANVERIYWYAWQDLDPNRAAIDGFHLDEREYHFGLRHSDGTPKLLHRIWEGEGVRGIEQLVTLAGQRTPAQATPSVQQQPYTLIVGGAGFIGSNLAHRLLRQGERVLIFDSLARPGVETNLRWLHEQFPHQLLVQIGDIRNQFALADAVRHAQGVYHFAAQVAVTTSMVNPQHDFAVNAQGTLNLLEALRMQGRQVPLLFTSTNKVYGDLIDVQLQQDATRYYPQDEQVNAEGIGEARPLAFHSPYGCSKGAADQYVIDYAHTYEMPATVYRMSCIYGPRQFGTEDQGWVAHFLIRALQQQRITLYGDGKQVRDILFVDDLVDALLLGNTQIDQLRGQAFNVGGGPQNAISLLELLALIEQLQGTPVAYQFDTWRRGDQRYYVSDTRKLQATAGWRANVSVQDGLERLYNWLVTSHPTIAKQRSSRSHTVASTTNMVEKEHVYGG